MAKDYDVFVSHSQVDASVAIELSEGLAALGLEVFNPSIDLPAGVRLESALADALDGSQTVVVLLSRQAAKSAWVRAEIREALQGGTHRVVPVLLDPDAPILPELAGSAVIRADSAPSPELVSRILAAIDGSGVEDERQGYVPPPSPAVPATREGGFINRDLELQALRSLRPGQIAVVSGSGGVGKTSLVRYFTDEVESSGEVVWWVSAIDSDTVTRTLAYRGESVGAQNSLVVRRGFSDPV